MTKLDFIKVLLNVDDNVFNKLDFEIDSKELTKLLLLYEKIVYIGNTDKIAMIEIDNDHIYAEPILSHKFKVPNDSDIIGEDYLSWDWKIYKRKKEKNEK